MFSVYHEGKHVIVCYRQANLLHNSSSANSWHPELNNRCHRTWVAVLFQHMFYPRDKFHQRVRDACIEYPPGPSWLAKLLGTQTRSWCFLDQLSDKNKCDCAVRKYRSQGSNSAILMRRSQHRPANFPHNRKVNPCPWIVLLCFLVSYLDTHYLPRRILIHCLT